MANEIAIRNAVLASASENSSLLVRLASTSEAPSTLRGQLTHVSFLRNALKEQTTALEKLKQEVHAHCKTHKKFRGSVARRFLYRATHMLEKFELKAMKAEREYFATLGAQSKAIERRSLFERDYEEAVKVQGPLEKAAKEHEEIHERIDKLYETLFSGPTPGFPYEDEREDAWNVSRAENDATKERILEARRAMKFLNVAQISHKRAQTYLGSAQRRAEDSILFFDDTFQTLRYENERISHALLAIEAAEKHLSPLSPQMSSTKDTLIENLEAAKIEIETLHSRDEILLAITQAQDSLSGTEDNLKELVEGAKQRERDGLSDIRGTARHLEDTREELQQTRQGIFEKVAGFGEAAPAYNECCDRTESYCIVPEETDESELELEDDIEIDGLARAETSHHVDDVGQHEPPGYENRENIPRPGTVGDLSTERVIKE